MTFSNVPSRIDRQAALLGVGGAAALAVGLMLGASVLFAAPSPTPAVGIALPDSPIFAVAETKPNVLMVLDNSNSMDEAPTGAAVGSNSPDSKSEIARGVIKSLISTYTGKMSMGLMTYQQNSPSEYYLHNSPYDLSYNPSNYDPTFTGDRASPTKRYRVPNPASPGDYIYYNVNLPFYAGSNQGSAFCYSATSQFPSGTNGPYSCYTSKTGTSDAGPPGNGYSGGSFNTSFFPTDSDYAQGISAFGRRMAWFYVSRTWYRNDSPGRGYLEVPIKTLDATQAGKLTTKLACNVPGNPSPCTSSGVKNAGLTPIEGTLLTAKDYFGGSWTTSSEGYTSGTYPLPTTCGKNYVILLTDGLPSTDRNGKVVSDPATAITAAANAAAQLKAAGVNTYVVGFALPYGTDPNTLNQIASAGGTTTAYNASDQASLDAALSAIFFDIYTKSASSGATTANSTGLSTDTRVYNASFNVTDWSGSLKGYAVDQATGVSSVASWQATIPAANSRKIFTWNGSSAVLFKWGSMPSTQKAQLGSEDVVEYLRGDQSQEGTTFRKRSSILGDIVDSAPVYVKEYANGSSPAMEIIAIGANDGMLHLFDVATGQEKFAYVPAGIDFANLKSYASKSYTHKYFVDGLIDITSREEGDGKNILIGTLGRGGRGAFALDITDPDNVKVLWDKTGSSAPAGMGYVIGQPFLAKTQDGTVAAFIPNGVTRPGDMYDGQDEASLFVLDATTGGSVYDRIDAIDNSDNSGLSNGLSSPRGWDSDGDGAVDYVYAGDYRGNVWKFDVSGNKASVDRFFVAEVGSTRQPITGGMSVSLNPSDFSVWVHFGTGRYLTGSDLSDKSTQSIYGVRDDGGSKTLKRQDLQARSIASNGTVGSNSVRFLDNYSALASGKSGWYVDLLDPPPPGTQQGERVVGTPQEVAGQLRVSSGIPGATACDPISGGYLYVLDAFTGTSTQSQALDVNEDGSVDGGDMSGGKVTSGVALGVGLLGDVVQTGNVLTGGGSSGKLKSIDTKDATTKGRIAWRELVND